MPKRARAAARSVAGAATGRPVTAVARAVAAVDRKREADAACARRQQPVRDAEVAVGLGQHERDPARQRGEPDRSGDVAAAAEDGVRPQLGEQPAGAEHGPRGKAGGARRAQRVRAAQAGDADRAQLVAGGRHELRLRALAADEDDVSARGRQPFGDRQRGHHVPRRPAGRDQHLGAPRGSSRIGPLAGRPGGERQVARAARGDVQQQPHRRQQDEQAARTRRDERQRHAGQRRDAEHRAGVQQRLAEDQAGQARRQQLLVARGGGLRDAQARVGDHPVEQQQPADPGDAELLADDGEDEVRVRLGQIEDLLHRFAEADAEEPAGAERDLALDRLKAGVARIRPRVDERRQPRHALGIDQREQQDERRRRRPDAAEQRQRRARDEQHRAERERDHERGAEVRLRRDQRRSRRRRRAAAGGSPCPSSAAARGSSPAPPRRAGRARAS